MRAGRIKEIVPRLLKGLGRVGRVFLLEEARVSQLSDLHAPPRHALGRQSMEPGVILLLLVEGEADGNRSRDYSSCQYQGPKIAMNSFPGVSASRHML